MLSSSIEDTLKNAREGSFRMSTVTLSPSQSASKQVTDERDRHGRTHVSSPQVFLTDMLLTPYRSLWVLFDMILAFWLFTLGIWASPYEAWGSWKYQHFVPALIFSISFAIVALGMGYYERPRRFTKSVVFGISLGAVFVSLLLSLSAVYFAYYEMIGRLSLLYGALAAYAGLACVRYTLSQFLRKNPFRFTILGDSQCAEEIRSYCKNHRRDARYYTYLDWEQDIFADTSERDLSKLRQIYVPNLVLAKSALENPEMTEWAFQAMQEGCRVVDEVTFYIQFFEKVPLPYISKSWILHEGIDTRPFFFSVGKRISDIVISLTALICLSPLFALLALIIKCTSAGPVFFIQTRMGRFCKPFPIIKFRTMTYNPLQTELVSTGVNDPRVTGIGRLMRPLHLDELPQLWNVLMGTMSIVGPRPEAADFAQKMRIVPLYDLRHLLRPGITGHAQITQGYTLGDVDQMTEKLEYDLYYLCKSSLMLDIRIMIRTFFCLMKGAR